MALEAEARTRLLGLARRSILDGLGQGVPPPLAPEAWPEALNEPRATFVTLKLAGELRGCRGTLEARCPLAQDLWRNAWFSAYADPRFRPVSGEEIARLEVAISVLTALTPLHVASETELLAALRPGIDGLVLRCGAEAATFLPAVWEDLPDPRDFLTQLKLKAGWAPSFWSEALRAERYCTETFRSALEPGRPGDS